MLDLRALRVAKRQPQPYNKVPSYDVDDDDDEAYDEKHLDESDDSSYVSSAGSSPTGSRVPSGVLAPPKRAPPRSSISAYSYRNPRAFTRYLGLMLGSIMLLFMYFLLSRSWASIRSAELGLHKQPSAPPVWESFPFLKRYHGGIRTLISQDKDIPEYPTKEDVDPEMPVVEEKSKVAQHKQKQTRSIPDSIPFSPYPNLDDIEYNTAAPRPCYLDANDTLTIPPLRAYEGVTEGMPDNVIGSYDIFGSRKDVCFERFGRLGPYGLGYSKRRGGTGAAMEGDREGIEAVWEDAAEVDYRQVRWRDVVDRCIQKNKDRFHAVSAATTPKIDTSKTKTSIVVPSEAMDHNRTAHGNETFYGRSDIDNKKPLPRTAVLIRTWSDYEYDDEDIMYLRSMISELSIASGGEYQVHFLIHVKDDNKQIWAEDSVYEQVLEKALPEEFAGMGTLWSERQMGLIYGGLEETMYRDLPVHGAYRSTYMPVTYFAHQHPEFEFFWNWEMDVRYTGHYYHLFDQVGRWADKQPRKGLWERNARFYVPAIHGSWEDFSQMVRVQTEHGTNSKANAWSSHLPPNPHMPEPEMQRAEKPVWGPEPPLDHPDIEIDPSVVPNTTLTQDKYIWGVSEPADLIVFNPLFDPDHTNWLLADDFTGYNTTQGPPPRRASINTSSRLSRRLLTTMHREQVFHRHTMFSEMWPASAALHHGLKAVYAPHPVFIDRKWPVQYLAAIFNNGRNGASGGSRLSVFSDEKQHNFKGTTWYYHAGHAPNLWKRWLGYRVDGDGGEEEEVAGEGRMCLPAMLQHPVKQVDLVQESGGEVGPLPERR